jgi:integrase
MGRRKRNGLPLHVSPAPDRHGKMRYRFRKGLFSTYLHAELGTVEFSKEYDRALAGLRAAGEQIGKSKYRAGTIAATILGYYRTPEFKGLKQSTQVMRRNVLDRFSKVHGSKPTKGLQRQHIKAIIGGMSDRPGAANNLLKFLRVVLEVAVDSEELERNPAAGLKGFKIRSEGHIPWTEDEISIFEAKHPIGTRPRLAMALLLYTGQRRSDVVGLGWQHVRENRISLRQEKTGKPMVVKIHPALSDALAHAGRDNLTFLMTERGAPFTAAGFGNAFREWCDDAGLKHLSAHGLRKSAAVRLADAGNSSKQIQAVTGQSLSEVERYTRAADQQRLADHAVDSMPDRSDRVQNFPNPVERLDKKRGKVLK